MSDMKENWLETNEIKEAVLALQLVNEQLEHLIITSNPYYWKWVIVGTHNALQGFMVLALRGSNNLNVLTEECSKEWLTAYECRKISQQVQKLADFLELYKRIKSERMKIYDTSKVFTPKGSQGRSIKKLNSLRNDFIHFIPGLLKIEISGLPQIIGDCLNTIEFLAFKCGNIFWYESSLEEQTREYLENGVKELNNISKAYHVPLSA